MQRMVVQEILSPKDKDRRAKQYQDWLTDNGYSTSLHARSLTQDLTQMLHQLVQISAAAEKLHAHIQDLINQNKPHEWHNATSRSIRCDEPAAQRPSND